MRQKGTTPIKLMWCNCQRIQILAPGNFSEFSIFHSRENDIYKRLYGTFQSFPMHVNVMVLIYLFFKGAHQIKKGLMMRDLVMNCRQGIRLHLPTCNLFYCLYSFSALVYVCGGSIERLIGIGIFIKRVSSHYTILTIYINIFGCYLFQSEQT